MNQTPPDVKKNIAEHVNEIDTLSIVTNAIDGFSPISNEKTDAENVLTIEKH